MCNYTCRHKLMSLMSTVDFPHQTIFYLFFWICRYEKETARSTCLLEQDLWKEVQSFTWGVIDHCARLQLRVTNSVGTNEVDWSRFILPGTGVRSMWTESGLKCRQVFVNDRRRKHKTNICTHVLTTLSTQSAHTGTGVLESVPSPHLSHCWIAESSWSWRPHCSRHEKRNKEGRWMKN